MRSLTVIFLLDVFALAYGEELAANQMADAQSSVDELVDNLVNRAHRVSTLDRESLDDTTLGKAAHVQVPTASRPANLQTVSAGSFYQPRFQQVGQNLPYMPAYPIYQPRSELLAPRGFLDKIFGNEGNPLYQSTEWNRGDKAEFFSKSKGGWIPCTIADVSDEGVQIDVKPGAVLNDKEVKRQLRKPYGQVGYPRPDRGF